MTTAHAIAHSNIALVKYWGKRDGATPDLNLPAVGSLSMTLDTLRTETTVRAGGDRDTFVLDQEAIEDTAAHKVFDHLDRVWAQLRPEAGPRPRAEVVSVNHLPTAAGLASSASGFAALTLAAAGAFCGDAERWRTEPGRAELSALARRGSGSAARSLWGGFVRLDAGVRDDGQDCLARPVAPAGHWDVRLLVVHTARGAKPVGSTGGMQRCRETSPYYPAWVESSAADLEGATGHLRARELEGLGEIMEHSCFKMHAAMWATRPPLIYWNAGTMAALHAVADARADGLTGYATSDAGPHVKVLTTGTHADALADRLRAVDGVLDVQVLGVGPDASLEVRS